MALGDGIRRNIAHVEPAERALLRDALIEVNQRLFPGSRTDSPAGGVTWWFKQDEIHQATHVHDGPEFLPWHREIVNRFEAMLREVNPQLSLHYWDWTQDPRNIPNANLGGGTTGNLTLFTPDFMGYGGSIPADIGEPWLSAGYYVPGAPNYRSTNPFDPVNNNPADPPREVIRSVDGSPVTPGQDQGVIDAPDYQTMRILLEGIHDAMHGFVNMGGQHTSFRDPFVFLLHSNVDRLFAMWQTDPGHPERLDPDTIYGTEGEAPSPLDNLIEPWSGVPPTTRPWAPPENEGLPKNYKHPSVVQPPCYDTLPISVELASPVSGAPITFNAVPEGVTTVRAAVFDVSSCSDVTLEIIGGTLKAFDPTAPFDTPLGTTTTVAYTSDWPRQGRVWVSYQGTTAGSVDAGSMTVRCLDTGDEWVIPITANTIANPKTAGMLVLDKSGSMAWDSGIPGARRLDVLKWAAPHYVHLMDDDDGIGIVSFDHDAYPVVGVAAAGPPVFGAGRAAALSAISTHDEDGGGTAIGDGLELGHNTVNPVAGFDHKALVVFTDGHETASKRISEVAGLLNERVFAIGLGRADQLDIATLDSLTSGSGGFLLMTGDLGADDLFRVSKYFLQVLAGVTNAETVVDPEATIVAGQEHRIPFRLNEADFRTDVVLLSPAAWAIEMALETPDGSMVTQADIASLPGAAFVEGSGVNFFRFQLPLLYGGRPNHGGRWHVLLRVEKPGFREFNMARGSATNPWFRNGVPYNLSVYARSTVSMRPSVVQTSHEPGGIVHLQALLSQYELPVTERARVRVEVARPDGTSTVVGLSQGEPGSYVGQFIAAVPGVYQLRFLSTGYTLAGFPFTREALRTAAVTPGGDRVPPTAQDDTWARLCELATCLLGSDELRKALSALGIPAEHVQRCLKWACERDQRVERNPARVAATIPDVQKLLNRPDIRRLGLSAD